MKITSYGAAGVVTGSCHLVETGKVRFLIDCGLFQGSKELNRLNYGDFLFDPATVDFLVSTHGHIDHCGLLPKLVKQGFHGNIYATPATADLLPIMLEDAAFIQEMDTEHENRRRLRQGQEPREPLYTREDAAEVYPLIAEVPYDESFGPAEGISLRLRNAGHVIGSAIVECFIAENGKETKVVFSGDLGQNNTPIIEDPSKIWNADYVYIESTYGDRLHDRTGGRKEKLWDYIKRTADRKGKLIIPSFALERTQELLYTISELREEHADFPPIKIYLDSPLAIKITNVFRTHREVYDEEALNRGGDPFQFPGLVISTTADESRRLNDSKEPAIIIAGSGMCNAGRIRHHIKHHIWDSRNTILFVGYQAPGTLGRVIMDGAKEIRMMGEILAVKAEVGTVGSFSAHGDRDELAGWLEAFRERPRKVFLVHGETDVLKNFSAFLEGKGFRTAIPRRGEPVKLD
jgi:metallo-beta-lactamase family protein